ncbi:hypothetical protein A9X06_27450 [Mycobacterium sp. 852002-51759_SCH5129042]|nr:hypothetical protein A9X06_27450 [Mycobacterium sp. 852002-51759_SCH5129042]
MTSSAATGTLPCRGIWLGSDYLDDVFDPDSLIADARTHLTTAGISFDTLVGTGLSGALIIPILAFEFGVDYALVRTVGDSSHARTRVEGFLGNSWLFVDDHIHTGRTFRYVHRTITDEAHSAGHVTSLAGSYCYQRALRGREPVMAATALYRHHLLASKHLPRDRARAACATTTDIRRARRDR